MDFSTALKFLSKAPADPFSSIALKTFNEFLTFGTEIHAVDRQTRDLLSTTRLVASNIKETRRLQRLKYAVLDAEQVTWINRVIEETEDALRNLAQLIEPARVDKELNGGIDPVNKVVWVIKEYPKVADMQARLSICHQSLMGVISCMHAKGTVSASRMPEERLRPHDRQLESFLGWQTQRKRKKNALSIETKKSQGQESSSNSVTAITTPINSESSSVRPNNSTSACLFSLPELDESIFEGFDPFKELHMDAAASNLPGPEAQHSDPHRGDLFVESMSNGRLESDTDSSVFEIADHYYPVHGANKILPTVGTSSYQDLDPSSNSLDSENQPTTPVIWSNLSFEFFDGLEVYDPYSPYHDFGVSKQQSQKPAATTLHALPWLSPSLSSLSLSASTGEHDPSRNKVEDLDCIHDNTLTSSPPIQSSGEQPQTERVHSNGCLSTDHRSGPTEQCGLTKTLSKRPKLCNFGRRTARSGTRSWMAFHASRQYSECDQDMT